MALGLLNSLTSLLFLFFAALVAGQDSSVTVQVGRRAVLRCDTSQIRFNFDTTWERADGTFLSRGNVYVIDSVSLNDRGTYVCRIRNVDDNAQVATSRLELNVVPENGPAPGGSASISSVPKANERLVIGGLIFRSCKVTDPTGGTWSYSWVYPDGRTTRSSLLYITNITPVHFGTYRCVATSSNGRRMETRFTVSPTSIKSTAAPAQGNRLSVNIVQAALGNPTILECVVEGGSGGYTYEWQKDGRVLQRGQRVTIDRLDASYGGTYECVVNGIGAGGQVRGVAKYNLRLRVKQTETKISLAPAPGPTHIVEAGSNKELHCELDQAQDRQEVARWYVSRDGSKRGMVALVPPTHKIYPTRSVSILVMSDMKVSDTGRYLCIVMRNGKEVRRDATVVVVKDVGLEVYPSTMVYILGQTRSDPEYHCQVDNLPGGAKAVKWSFVPGNQPNAPEQPLPSNAKLSMRPGIFSTSFLSIRNPTMSNYGYYICRAPGGFSGRAALVVRGGGGIGRNVVRLLVKPGTTVTVDAGQTARVLCFEPSGQLGIVPNWRVPPNLQGQVTTEEQSQRRILRFRDVRPDQDGTQFVCYYRDAPPVTVTIRVNAGCPFGQRRCRSGTCIQDSLFCNGRRDCPDGSDEDRANCAKCEPNEQECQRHNNRNPIKKCVPVHWVCDGEDDCGNNWDESQNCQTGVGCDKTLFQCDDGRRIPRGFLCDGENDCRRNDDENGCSVPRIVRPSGGRPIIKRANRGSEVRLVCEAVGKGTPKIVWRYNWGFVTARNNIQERCIDPDTDISTLILSSVDIRDAGIYTCEALNNQGRAFGEDYVVEVNAKGKGPCQPPLYNDAALNSTGCIPCFCFGLTQDCRSAKHLKIKPVISSESRYDMVDYRKDKVPEGIKDAVSFNTKADSYQVQEKSLPHRNVFLRFAGTLAGNKVGAYSQNIEFSLRFGAEKPNETRNEVDIILKSADSAVYAPIKLSKSAFVMEYAVKIQLQEKRWFTDPELKTQATRIDLMMVLQNMTGLLVRTNYFGGQANVTIRRPSMDVAVKTDAPLPRAYTVEACKCPFGYTGLSCERCSPGFKLVADNSTHLGRCEMIRSGRSSCMCFNHSITCDPNTEVCIDCQHNTQGENCDECKPGFYGDPSKGAVDDCSECECPGTPGEVNYFAHNCTEKKDAPGGHVCGCLPGYTGPHCEKCSEGFSGDPAKGKRCVQCACNNHSTTCDADGRCLKCQDNTTGAQCHRCMKGFYGDAKKGKNGCKPCECNKHSDVCDKNGKCLYCKDNTTGNTCDECLKGFYGAPKNGGMCMPCACNGHAKECDSTGKCLNCRNTTEGDNCERCSAGYYGDPTTGRADACKSCECYGHASLCDSAGNCSNCSHNTTGERCHICKEGFYGDARQGKPTDCRPCQCNGHATTCSRYGVCQECRNKTTGDFCHKCEKGYFGYPANGTEFDCKPCACNNHSASCDQDGLCRDCQHNTAGDRCEKCVAGFEGNATAGTSEDCKLTKECICNNHSLTCDDNGICKGCMHNTTGARCEQCRLGFYGNAASGSVDACKPCLCNNHSAKCDSRGICYACENNTVGDRCERCSFGFFGNATTGSPDGCQPCQCNNHSNQCTNEGKCFNCRDSSAGDNCERCLPGFYGNATVGRASDCKTCKCPGEPRSGQYFAQSCSVDANKTDGHRCNCSEGYTGEKCEKCSPGFRKASGNRCVPVENPCFKNGTERFDPQNVTCTCKENYNGTYCRACVSGRFSPSRGCPACFCSGTLPQNECYDQSDKFAFKEVPLPLESAFKAVRMGFGFEAATPEMVKIVGRSVSSSVPKMSCQSFAIGLDSPSDLELSSGGEIRATVEVSGGGVVHFDGLEIQPSKGRRIFQSARRTLQNASEAVAIPVNFRTGGWTLLGKDQLTRQVFLDSLRRASRLYFKFYACAKESQVEVMLKNPRRHLLMRRQAGESAPKDAPVPLVGQCVCPVGHSGSFCEKCSKGFSRVGGPDGRNETCEGCPEGHTGLRCKDCKSGYYRQDFLSSNFSATCRKGLVVKIEPGDVDAVVGSRVKIVATVESTENDQVVDMKVARKDGQPLSGAAEVRRKGRRLTFVIRKVKPEDAGEYAVTVVNRVTAVTRVVKVNVIEKPKISINVTIIPSGSVDGVEGKPLNITVLIEIPSDDSSDKTTAKPTDTPSDKTTVSPDGKTTVSPDGKPTTVSPTEKPWARITVETEWRKNGKKISPSEVGAIIHKIKGRRSFFIKRLKKSDNGTYTVTVTTGGSGPDGQTEKREIVVRVHESEKPKVPKLEVTPSELKAKFGSSGSVKVACPPDAVKPTVRWSRLDDGKLQPLPRGMHQEGPELIVDFAAAEHTGTYVAQITGMGYALNKTANITVEDLQPMGVLKAKVGDQVVMPSKASSCKLLKVDSRNISDNSILNDNFVIKAAQLSDSGMYNFRCFVFNQPSLSGTFRFNLTVEPKCFCYNHAAKCDEEGWCVNCTDNTRGGRCERCMPGFHGDPTKGTKADCKPCACPLPYNTTNYFAQSCSTLGSSFKCECNKGYAGQKCEKCADGYAGEPQKENGRCEKVACSKVGTNKFELKTKECKCHEGFTGEICDRCAPGYMNPEKGCIKCYCSARGGANCTDVSSSFVVVNEAAHFQRVYSGERSGGGYEALVKLDGADATRAEVKVAPERAAINLLYDVQYSRQMMGESYAGDVSFSTNLAENIVYASVEITSDRVPSRMYTSSIVNPSQPGKFRVRLEFNPSVWSIADVDGWNKRAAVLHVLRNSRFLVLRLRFANITADSEPLTVSNLKIEKSKPGKNQDPLLPKARAVELCSCPEGYSGASCEICDSNKGYRQMDKRNETRDFSCTKCQFGYMGKNCSKCEPGFYMKKGNDGKSFCMEDLSMTVRPRDLRIYPGASATVECRITHRSKTLISAAFFKPSGERVTSRGLIWSAVDRGNQQVTLRLHFSDVRAEDAGSYECRAVTERAERTEKVRIFVAPGRSGGTKKSYKLIVTPKESPIYVQIGQPVKITATVDPPEGKVKIYVYNPNGTLTETSKSGSGSVEVSAPAKGNNGTWRVVAWVDVDSDDSYTLRKDLPVITFTDPDAKPVFNVTASHEAPFGKPTRFRVIQLDNGAGRAQVTWQREIREPKKSTLPLPEGTEQQDRDLVIPFAADELTGAYVAIITYRGTIVLEISRNLTVGEMEPPQERNYTVGDTFEYKPKKPGVWLTHGPSGTNLTEKDGNFTKPNLQVNDTGDIVVHTPVVKRPFLSGRARIRITVELGCLCYGHSLLCDDKGGCLNCSDNTAGRQCDRCADGFFGDAKKGKDGCRACSCPGPKGSERYYAKSCSANATAEKGHVCSCIEGHSGRNCSECAKGFVAASNGSCRAIPCNLAGMDKYNATANTCECKSNFAGKLCDQCAPGFVGSKVGCRPCYCSSRGATNCSDATSDYKMQQDRLISDNRGVFVARRTGSGYDSMTNESVRVEPIANRIFVALGNAAQTVNLVLDVRGDRLFSYFGQLVFDVDRQKELQFVGIELLSTSYPNRLWTTALEGKDGNFRVRLEDDRSLWRASGAQFSRTDFMEVLRNLRYLVIRLRVGPSASGGPREVSVGKLELDRASSESGKNQAVLVERCTCPKGYAGASCQECDEKAGYLRYKTYPASEGRGFRCVNCKSGHEGDKCEKCIEGFYKPAGEANCQKGLSMDLEPGDVDVNLFATLRLACRVTFTENDQLVSLRWRRADGRPLAPFAVVRRKGFALDLEIPGIRKEDAGRYRCEAASPKTSMSVTSEVRVREDGSQPQLIVEPSGRQFVPAGGRLLVSARVEPPNGAVRFIWTDGKGQKVASEKSGPGKARIEVTPTDANAGEWAVVAVLNEGSANETTLRRTFPVVVHPDEKIVPILKVVPDKLKVKFGAKARVTVEQAANGAAAPQVEWRKKNSKGGTEALPDGCYQDGNDLVIDFAASEHTGLFEARVSYLGKPRPSLSVNVSVGDMHPPKEQVVITGKPASMKFSKQPYAKRQVTSSVKNLTIVEGDEKAKPEDLKINNKTMDIEKTRMWHTGTYKVRQYPFANLNVSGIYKHTLVINEASDVKPVMKWKSVKLAHKQKSQVKCVHTRGRPIPKVFIRRANDVPLSENAKITNGTGEAIIDFDPFIIADDTGHYLCAGINRAGTHLKIVDISLKKGSNPIRPSMHIESNDDRNVVNGSTFAVRSRRHYNLTCVVSALPAATIKWYFKFFKREGDLPRSNIWEEAKPTRLLGVYRNRLEGVSSLGYYRCLAYNDYGNASITFRVDKEEEKIKVDITPVGDSQYWRVYVGDDANFTCIARNPKDGKKLENIKYKWKPVNGKKFSDIAESYLEDGNVLRLKKLKKGSGLGLTCRTTQDAYDAAREFYITAKERDVPVKLRLKNILKGEQTNMSSTPETLELNFMKTNSSVLVLCEADGLPKPGAVKWKVCYDDDADQDCANSQVISAGNAVLNFSSVADVTNRKYRCEARNTITDLQDNAKESTAFKDLVINIFKPPAVELTTSGVKKIKGDEYRVLKNKQMILICDVNDGYPKPNMTWTKDGGKIPKEADVYTMYDGLALKIRNSDLNPERHSGTYTLVASNVMGNATCKFDVTVPADVSVAYRRALKANLAGLRKYLKRLIFV